MNNLQIFEKLEFGQIRMVEVDKKPYFVATDIAKCLGYANTSKAINDHCRWVTKSYIPHPQNENKVLEVNAIPESDMYRLIVNSKLPNAEKFESWVFDEVLPTIRKTGGYIHTTEDMSDDEIMARALQVAQRKIESKNRELEEKNRFINQIASSKNSLLVREVAKVISKSNGIIIGEKRLYEKLRVWGLVFKNSTEPKQFAVEKGYLETVEGTRETSTGVFTYRTTRVTGKGQEYILKRLLKEEEEQLSLLS
ncbi:TPA: phage antirepressor KilAC domain-containing protein [Clostridioides difficile]|uniref:phage antirepressor n=1 Tax=Clostridioides difficile TaxID=1496 RepID=UPI001034D297|nr:phage antirepressor KilAC domain-containing protein [Clostridioides difficile]MCI4263554.1 phage antirepressor KilAC domain-containing protein [Clostridioides difficile]HBH1606316.1 phage antirepressor KilAC domain-containing protein [Clostridioides difficile]HEK4596695.1 phage antirepressor KilAC domain-containing protein [Clostridioides difficile]HEK4907139.1 phage antirepressor KilAC domain-containing protein [Clostridioides difficile]HEK4970852.1 phage antirepressor KilAC domain-contain